MRGSLSAAASPAKTDLERLLLVALLYAALMTRGSFDLLHPIPYGLTFNSMLEHLLRGRLDVDPAAIGNEGFLRDGRTYAYFGILPALLRLPLAALGRLGSVDITRLSLLLAVVLAAACKLRTIGIVARQASAAPAGTAILAMLTVATLLGGAQMQFLKASIYQEAVSWADAIAAAFVYCAVAGLLGERRFDRPLLLRMAALAGLALLTRVSTGLGLYLALGFLLIAVADGEHRSGWGARAAALARGLLTPRILLPAGTLLLFAALCGAVNYFRWGNPLTFADLHASIMYNTAFADRLPRLDRYGEFNLARLGYGLMYYFLPLWVIITPGGNFLFGDFQQRLIESAELPPGSFLLTDPLLIVLAIVCLRALWRGQWARPELPRQAAALLLGLAVPAFLMLIAISMTFRYRMEFYPFLELAAFLGCHALCRAEAVAGGAGSGRLVGALWIATAGGCAAAFLLGMLYRLSPFGPATILLPFGWLNFYTGQITGSLSGLLL